MIRVRQMFGRMNQTHKMLQVVMVFTFLLTLVQKAQQTAVLLIYNMAQLKAIQALQELLLLAQETSLKVEVQ